MNETQTQLYSKREPVDWSTVNPGNTDLGFGIQRPIRAVADRTNNLSLSLESQLNPKATLSNLTKNIGSLIATKELVDNQYRAALLVNEKLGEEANAATEKIDQILSEIQVYRGSTFRLFDYRPDIYDEEDLSLCDPKNREHLMSLGYETLAESTEYGKMLRPRKHEATIDPLERLQFLTTSESGGEKGFHLALAIAYLEAQRDLSNDGLYSSVCNTLGEDPTFYREKVFGHLEKSFGSERLEEAKRKISQRDWNSKELIDELSGLLTAEIMEYQR